MPKYLPLSAIRTMTYEELEIWWEKDFQVLASTAVAEATGTVHSTVAEALRSDDWLEQWNDALYSTMGGLLSSVERMTFSRDHRLEATTRKAGLVTARLGEVNALVNRYTKEQGLAMLDPVNRDAYWASLSILSRHYFEDTQAIAFQERERLGLSRQSIFFGTKDHADKYDAIAEAVSMGFLAAPVTAEVEAALRMPPFRLTQLVALDVTKQEERQDVLRHPLLLRGWKDALTHLRDVHCELAGLRPMFSVNLPKVDFDALHAMPYEEAQQLLNRRRFIRSVAQRYRECEMHGRQVSRAVGERKQKLEKPWRDTWQFAQEEVGRRHPRQLQALLAGLAPFCEPGSTRYRLDMRNIRRDIPNRVIPLLKQAIKDGTWVHLLGEQSA